MHRAFNFVILAAALVVLFSLAISYATPATAPAHTQCSSKELSRRDCEVTLKPYKAQLSRMKITWSDGTWTSIGDAPLSEEKNQWEKAKFEKIDQRYFVQFWIWDDGKGEAKVQSLHWVVLELKEKQLIPLLDKIVRKREVRDTKPTSYAYDKMISHNLKKAKSGLQWSLGKDNGTI
jgi:hypothetical protein